MTNHAFSFGDLLVNEYASEDNPLRKGIYVRTTSKGIQLTDGNGNFWTTAKDNDRLKKVDTVLSETLHSVKSVKKAPLKPKTSNVVSSRYR